MVDCSRPRALRSAPTRPAARACAFLLLASLTPLGCAPETTGPSDAQLAVVGGDGQTALTGLPLADSLVVRVIDSHGQPLSRRTVRWSATGDDSLSATSGPTATDGTARVLWFLGLDTGPHEVLAIAGSDTVRFQATAERAAPNGTYTGRRGYITYRSGTLPLIISAPHGGTAEPDEIPDRSSGTLVRDVNTDVLAEALADAIDLRLGGRPHLIIDRLHRRKMDANRELAEAAAGNPLAEQAWHEFQRFIEHARRRVTETHGAGLYVDLHGHGHAILRLELGYLLDAGDLARPDTELEDSAYATATSIRHLAATAGVPFAELVRGDPSLGALFQVEGVPAVPSSAQPDPGGAPFFSGGYNVRRHGSRDGGSIDGIQIETHRVGLRDTPENRLRFAAIAAGVIERYLEAHYGYEP